MSNIHRSAMGKSVDMAAMIAKNEKVRAVGNMSVNARGDVLDSHNRIIRDNTQRVRQSYNKTVSSGMMPTVDPTELSPEEQMFEDEDSQEIIKK